MLRTSFNRKTGDPRSSIPTLPFCPEQAEETTKEHICREAISWSAELTQPIHYRLFTRLLAESHESPGIDLWRGSVEHIQRNRCVVGG